MEKMKSYKYVRCLTENKENIFSSTADVVFLSSDGQYVYKKLPDVTLTLNLTRKLFFDRRMRKEAFRSQEAFLMIKKIIADILTVKKWKLDIYPRIQFVPFSYSCGHAPLTQYCFIAQRYIDGGPVSYKEVESIEEQLDAYNLGFMILTDKDIIATWSADGKKIFHIVDFNFLLNSSSLGKLKKFVNTHKAKTDLSYYYQEWEDSESNLYSLGFAYIWRKEDEKTIRKVMKWQKKKQLDKIVEIVKKYQSFIKEAKKRKATKGVAKRKPNPIQVSSGFKRGFQFLLFGEDEQYLYKKPVQTEPISEKTGEAFFDGKFEYWENQILDAQVMIKQQVSNIIPDLIPFTYDVECKIIEQPIIKGRKLTVQEFKAWEKKLRSREFKFLTNLDIHNCVKLRRKTEPTIQIYDFDISYDHPSWAVFVNNNWEVVAPFRMYEDALKEISKIEAAFASKYESRFDLREKYRSVFGIKDIGDIIELVDEYNRDYRTS